MSIKKTLAGVRPFAHLLSNGPRAARAEEDRDEDEHDEQAAHADNDPPESDDDAKHAEGEDRDEGDEGEDKKGKKAGKAKKADKDNNDVDGDDADAEDDDGDDDTAKKAARVERDRCARIIAHGIKIGAVRQAGVFAFDTGMSASAAISALDASRDDQADRPAKRASLTDRMSAAKVPNPGAGAPAAAPSLADQIVAAGKKRRGEA